MRRIPFWILPGLPLDQGFQLATGGRLIHGSYWFKFRKTKLSLSLAFLTILSKYRLFLWGWGRHQFICSLEIFLWDNKELKRTPEHQVCGCQGLKSPPQEREEAGIVGSLSIALKGHRAGTGGIKSREKFHGEDGLYWGWERRLFMRAEHSHTDSKVALQIHFSASSPAFLFYRNLVGRKKNELETLNIHYDPTTGCLGLENDNYGSWGKMI